MMAFTIPFREDTYNREEFEAASFGFPWTLELDYRNIVLEVDSLLVVNLIRKSDPAMEHHNSARTITKAHLTYSQVQIHTLD